MNCLRNYVGKVCLAFGQKDKATAIIKPRRLRVEVGQLFVLTLGERVVAHAERSDIKISGELFPVGRPVPRDETHLAFRVRELRRLLRPRLIHVDDEIQKVPSEENLLAVRRPERKRSAALAVERELAQVSAVHVDSPNFVVPASVRRERYAPSVGRPAGVTIKKPIVRDVRPVRAIAVDYDQVVLRASLEAHDEL